MKKNLKIIAYLIIAILLAFIIFKISTYREPTFNKVELGTKNFVFNKTTTSYLDTIVSVGLDQLQLDSIIVTIKPLSNSSTTDALGEVSIKAYVIGENNQFIIYISNNDKISFIDILSHELIHLRQYYNKQLIINGSICIWEGDTINTKILSYENRPWEIDAEINKKILSSKMKSILLK